MYISIHDTNSTEREMNWLQAQAQQTLRKILLETNEHLNAEGVNVSEYTVIVNMSALTSR